MSAAVALAALALGCDEAPASAPALGVASLDLTLVPAEARCAVLEVKGAGNVLVTRTVPLGPGAAAAVSLDGLPIGTVTLNEKVYTAACADLAGLQPTWIADQLTVMLQAGVPADVTLVLRRVGAQGQVTVRTDFPVSTPVLTDFALPAMSAPMQITAGPDGNVWFTERAANRIGRLTPTGTLTHFDLPTAGTLPGDITTHPDGGMWFTQAGTPKLGRITSAGAIREFPIPSGVPAVSLAGGPDGNIWFARSRKLGRATNTGVITEFTMPAELRHICAGPADTVWFTTDRYIGRYVISTGRLTPFPLLGEDPQGITLGPDGALWITIPAGKIARMTSDGASTVYALAELGAGRTPELITAGTDGALWFTSSATGTIGRISVAGVLSEFLTPSDSQPLGITTGPDGALWYTDSRDRIGRVRF
jgi:virginiamycin B lyase